MLVIDYVIACLYIMYCNKQCVYEHLMKGVWHLTIVLHSNSHKPFLLRLYTQYYSLIMSLGSFNSQNVGGLDGSRYFQRWLSSKQNIRSNTLNLFATFIALCTYKMLQDTLILNHTYYGYNIQSLCQLHTKTFYQNVRSVFQLQHAT